jgi:hypothetical protein
MMLFLAVNAALLSTVIAVSAIRCGVPPCNGGCHDQDGNGVCQAAPAGHYSPNRDNALYECAPGSYALAGSKQCTLCEPGRFNDAFGTENCFTCSYGQYAPEPGATQCLKCIPIFYSGPGAYEVFVMGNDKFCLLPRTDYTPAPSSSRPPSHTPTTSPTVQPSRIPSHRPSSYPSDAPSTVPTHAAPSAAPSRLILPTRVPITTSPTLKPTVEENKYSARNEALRKYGPLLIVALLLFVFAAIVYWYRQSPRKTKRPLRTIPAPPPLPNNDDDDDDDDDNSLIGVYIED